MVRKFISNVSLTNYFPDRIVITSVASLGIDSQSPYFIFKLLFLILGKFDGIIVLNPSFKWSLYGAIAKFFSLWNIKIVYFDLLLSRPYSIKDKIKANIKKILFKFVDRLIFLHKDTSGYSLYYGIKPEKCTYIPFKANNLDKTFNYEIHDGGYILSCGASHRDYILLAQALKLYPCTTMIVLPEQNNANYHHSVIDETLFGEHVNIIRHDFNSESWNNILSKCRAVILPIRSDVIQGAGISVYLEAMAFGKPVVITECPATRGILTDEMAVICPPDEPVALSDAIKRVREDESYRIKIGNAGRRYAESLGGEDRLVKDILQTLIEI